MRAHSSTIPEQLNLENGQLILILSKNASGWWLGELQVSVQLLFYCGYLLCSTKDPVKTTEGP